MPMPAGQLRPFKLRVRSQAFPGDLMDLEVDKDPLLTKKQPAGRLVSRPCISLEGHHNGRMHSVLSTPPPGTTRITDAPHGGRPLITSLST